MHSPQATTNFWPTRAQELLLRACLLQGDAALAAWREWQGRFETGRLDAAERRLAPLLYRNLHEQGLRGPLMDRLKEEYNRTWSQNQFAFHRAAELIRAFDRAGIQTILLKGSALATLFYRDAGLRPMMDIDLLVRRWDALPAVRLLKSLGWKAKFAAPEALVPFEHAVEFTDTTCQNLDLHWRALWEGRQAADDEDFWRASIPCEIDGVPTRTLNASDQLLHVCVHGAKWNDTAPVRWVADAWMILHSSHYQVDWARLLQLAQERQLTLPLRDALAYLQQSLGAPIPPRVLSDLQNSHTTKLERQFYRIRLGSNDALRTLPVLWHWGHSLRAECGGHLFRRLTQFLQYLRCLWGLERMRHVPAHLMRRLITRGRQLIKWRLRRKWAATRPAE